MVSDGDSRASLLKLPVDVLLDSILILLHFKDLLALSQTCRALHLLIQNTESLWRHKVAVDYRFPIHATGRVTGFKTLYRKLRRPQVWVWGQNSNGRLGFDGEGDDSRLLRRVSQNYDEVPTPIRLRKAELAGVIDLQAGGWSFHALDYEGNVWFWGTLDGLSRPWGDHPPHRLSHPDRRVVSRPTMLEINNLPQFKVMSCGRSHTLAVCDEGHLYEWYSWSRIARLHPTPWATTGSQPGNLFAQISASWDFSAILLNDGSIYYWKEPSPEEANQALASRFGPGPPESEDLILYDLDSANRIIRCPDVHGSDALTKETRDLPIKIATGLDFIICLTRAGKIYKLDVSPLHNGPQPGRFGSPLLGLGDEEEGVGSIRHAFLTGARNWEYLEWFCEPEKLKASLQTASPDLNVENGYPKVTHISGQHETFVAYCVEAPGGANEAVESSFVFIGKKTTQKSDKPDVLPGLQGKGVIQVCLGDYHYVALLSNGQLLSWGNYSGGALGLGHSLNPHRTLHTSASQLDHLSAQPEQGPIDLERDLSPTVLQTFTGTQKAGSGLPPGASSPSSLDSQIPRRYVFLATAAGWHTGCLAFTLDEDEDHDCGLAVLQGEVPSEDEDDDSPVHRLPYLNPNGPLRFRIGYPGRFMRGASHRGTAGGLLSHRGLRLAVEHGVGHDIPGHTPENPSEADD